MPIPLLTPAEMALWDRLTIDDFGIPGEMLMEIASRELLHVLQATYQDLEQANVVLFAGSGNNGGDVFALSRHLTECKAKCLVLHTRELDTYTGDTAFHLALAQKSDVRMIKLTAYNLEGLSRPDIIVDGLLGTGFSGVLREDYQQWITAINRLGRDRFVLAVDIPSGLDGTTGRPGPVAIRADCTVTFEEAKIGLFMPEAAEYVGDLRVGKIGIPDSIKKAHPPDAYGLDQEVLQHMPACGCLDHKGVAGHLLIIGGSPGLTGAPTLAALGALRAGSGLVTVAAPEGLCREIKQGWPDIMTLPLRSGISWSRDLLQPIQAWLEKADAVVIGPGIGREPETVEFIHEFTNIQTRPTVFDADALFALAQAPDLLQTLGNESVLTPHPGEMARLCDRSTAEVQADRPGKAREISDKTGSTVILKGPGTVIATPGAPLSLSPFACCNLAVGGSGDVLSGMLGSLLSRGLSPMDAACLAVYWHCRAGQQLQQDYPFRGNLAQEIAHALPQSLDLFKDQE